MKDFLKPQKGMENAGKCLLCESRDLEYGGVFIPDEKFGKRLGVPKGKQRQVWYSLCGGCYDIPDKADRIELYILKHMGVQ